MDNLYNQKVIDAQNVFDNRFLDSKNLYLQYFNALPSLHYMGQIDGEKSFKAFYEKFGNMIQHVHKYRWYKYKQKKYEFDRTVVILNNQCLLEFNQEYFEILHNGKADEFIQEITLLFRQFKERNKKQPLEINLIVQGTDGMELKEMEIKRSKLDVTLFYEDDFKEVDEEIRKRLNQKNDKGIVLLHGLPGTGKTTYLRYLIGRIKKRVLFLSPNVAANLMNPSFIDLLIGNPNTVLIIEDAENIIRDRRVSNDSSVSNLLNLSDGLLADFLNVQLICTFNSQLTMVDKAFMRKGRLIAKYEFGKLSVQKSQRLSDHLGFKSLITIPRTLAEITHQHEMEFETKQTSIIGFRREAIIMDN